MIHGDEINQNLNLNPRKGKVVPSAQLIMHYDMKVCGGEEV
jgi:hypothetical protein